MGLSDRVTRLEERIGQGAPVETRIVIVSADRMPREDLEFLATICTNGPEADGVLTPMVYDTRERPLTLAESDRLEQIHRKCEHREDDERTFPQFVIIPR